ncbi:hypothetical protein [Synechococcus sp. GFB01]|uniref:hypothetical protein n=1 Tax=Synechococcus sp. GFB01 TaxID=1662190 RepID=UPI00128CA5E0|nr:hypothetical protein [Synechococcus sp. GFB01]
MTTISGLRSSQIGASVRSALAADAADRETVTSKWLTVLDPENLSLNRPAIWGNSDGRSKLRRGFQWQVP